MSGKLIFKDMELLRKLVDHVKTSPDRSIGSDDLFDPKYHKGGVIKNDENGWPLQDNIDMDKVPPALFLVKDQGVYLMSSGIPNLKDPKANDENRSLVLYADGLNPEKNEFDDWWNKAIDIMGGDDCCISLEISFFEKALRNKADKVIIAVTPSQVSAGYTVPKKAVKAGAKIKP